MKATIVRPDGTRIEAEGTPEEIAKLAPATVFIAPASVICSCHTIFPCPLHSYRWPGLVYGANLNAAAAGPNAGQVWMDFRV